MYNKVKELGGQKGLDTLNVLVSHVESTIVLAFSCACTVPVWFQTDFATGDDFEEVESTSSKQHVFAIPVIDFATMGDIPLGQHWLILTYQGCGNIEGSYDLDAGVAGVAGLQLQFSRLAYVEPHWPGDGDSDSRSEFLFWYKRFASGVNVGRVEYLSWHDLAIRVAPAGACGCTTRRVAFDWVSRDHLQCKAETELWWSLVVEGTDVHAVAEDEDIEMDWSTFGAEDAPTLERRAGAPTPHGDMGAYGLMYRADADGEEVTLEGALEEIMAEAMAEDEYAASLLEPVPPCEIDIEAEDEEDDAQLDHEGTGHHMPALFQLPEARPWCSKVFAHELLDVTGYLEYKDISVDESTFKCMFQLPIAVYECSRGGFPILRFMFQVSSKHSFSKM